MISRRAAIVATLTCTGGGLVWWSRKNNGYGEDSQLSLVRSLPPAERRAALAWRPEPRDRLIERLKGEHGEASKHLDLLIVGGGSVGCGCALDAASRGLKVACVERGDWGGETSSRSTKLVHGGVRYLEKAILSLDWEQFKLVREALTERAGFLQLAPHLARSLAIMLPIYEDWWRVPYYWFGSKAYDWLSGSLGLESSYYLNRTKALDAFPLLRQEGLLGAMVYYDGQMDDARVNLALALTALQQGALVCNYTEVVSLLKGPDGKLEGAMIKNVLTGETFPVYAKGIVNATGPFCDELRRLDDPTIPKIVTGSAGSHLILPHYFSPRQMGLVDPNSSDGRVIFFLPWEQNVIAGTTDAPSPVESNPMAGEREIGFILNEVKGYLNPAVQVQSSDILAAWAGIRPLIRDPRVTSTEALVRNHAVLVSPSGMLTIAGGKWTTYRRMAEDCIDHAISLFGKWYIFI